jgi:hypothetical protein
MVDIKFGQTVIENWVDKLPLEVLGNRENRLVFIDITFIILTVAAISSTTTINRVEKEGWGFIIIIIIKIMMIKEGGLIIVM